MGRLVYRMTYQNASTLPFSSYIPTQLDGPAPSSTAKSIQLDRPAGVSPHLIKPDQHFLTDRPTQIDRLAGYRLTYQSRPVFANSADISTQLDTLAGVLPHLLKLTFPNSTGIPTKLDRPAGVAPHLRKLTNISLLDRPTSVLPHLLKPTNIS